MPLKEVLQGALPVGSLVVLLFYDIPNSPFARVGGYYNDKVMKKGPPGGVIPPLKETPPACNRFRTFVHSVVTRDAGVNAAHIVDLS
jgi:hypothetical protein